MKYYRYHNAYIPQTRPERISETLEFHPKKFNMPNMSSINATFHAAQDLIYAPQNISQEIPQVKLGNVNKEALRTLSETSIKSIRPAVPLRVPNKG